METVYVIGAGASKEAGLPTGEELKSEISRLLNVKAGVDPTSADSLIMAALQTYAKSLTERNQFYKEAKCISDALPLVRSIDSFIDKHRGNEKIALCGKLAIVRSILNAEKNSRLYFDKNKTNANINFKHKSFSKSWYMSFFKIITDDCTTKNDLNERFKKITLIIFNYDRCVEHFLYCALQCCYAIDKLEAAELVKSINIFHPYGSVGTLPWLHEDGNIEFGADLEPQKLLELAQEIKTFTEGTDPKLSRIDQIKLCMGAAQKFIFLGFAFHKLNMRLIGPEVGKKIVPGAPICFATAHGFSEPDQFIIKSKISALLARTNHNHSPSITVSSSTCGIFFNEFTQTLSFG